MSDPPAGSIPSPRESSPWESSPWESSPWEPSPWEPAGGWGNAELEADGLLQIGPDQADQRLVVLHGWGADADDLLDLGAMLVGPEVQVVALRAPHPHPGGIGRQWYDLQQQDWPQLPSARIDLRTRLESLASSIPIERTALLGFSQGAAMALDVATNAGRGASDSSAAGLPLAALIACSGYPHPGWQPQPRTKVLLTHGEQDPVVPFAASEELERLLNQAGGFVQRVAFKGGHGIDASLVPLMRTFLESGWQTLL